MSAVHITLGIFQRLFELLEMDCHTLDLKLSLSSGQLSHSSTSLQRYMEAKQKVTALQEEIKMREGQLLGMVQLSTYITLALSTCATDQRLTFLKEKADELKQKIISLVS